MASDTVPAVPDSPPRPAGPATPTDTENPAGTLGWLASAVAPIDPARPQFDLTPDAAAGPDSIPGQPAASSTDFAIQPDPPTDTTSSGGAKEGVWRTWLRAAAERWRRGGDIHVKRLEMLKAKAQAVQLKESRTVTVNRSPGITTNAGAGGGSGLGSKSNGSKNTPGSGGGRGSGGGARNRSDAGSGSGRPAAGPRPGNGSHRTDRGQDAAGRGSSHRDRNASRDRRNPSKDSAGKPSADTRSKSPKDTTSPRTPASGSGSGAGPKTPKGSRTTGGTDTATCGDSSSINNKRPPKDKNTVGGGTAPAARDPKTGSGGTKQPGKPTTPGTGTGKPVDLTKHDKTKPTAGGKTADGKDTTAAKPKGETAPDAPTGKDSKPEKTGKDGKKPVTGPDGTPVHTQPTREAGYRDGSRIATVVAHGQAYKDGVKDGYRDTKDATDREKTRLDTAHHDRRQQRPAPVPRAEKKEKPVQPTDYQAPLTEQAGPVRPLRAATVTGTHVVLDNGQPGTPPIPPMPLTPPAGSMQVCTRGEVRSLKSYERMLEAKVSVMTFTADSAKALEAHAHQQYLKAITLLEQAREIKGGEALLADLARMAENTGVQAQQAAQLRKRAVRGVDATTSLLINVKIRYGEVYKAICNSPLTTPAELDFYNDRSSTHA